MISLALWYSEFGVAIKYVNYYCIKNLCNNLVLRAQTRKHNFLKRESSKFYNRCHLSMKCIPNRMNSNSPFCFLIQSKCYMETCPFLYVRAKMYHK